MPRTCPDTSWSQPSLGARRSLHALLVLFVRQHAHCLMDAAGGRFTHLVTVPSTRDRAGPHPLEELAVPALRLPVLAASSAARYPDDDRSFHPDRFQLSAAVPEEARVLLLDDTWTTGGRAQSLAYLLREHGADRVVCVVLGRHMGPDFPLNRPILQAVDGQRFDIDRCVLCAAEPPTPLA
jgi:hypothetical protein